MQHKFDGSMLELLSAPGSSNSVLEVDINQGKYRPARTKDWESLGPKLHQLAALLLAACDPGLGWVPPQFDLYFNSWNEHQPATLKAARTVWLRLIELCSIISMGAAAAWVKTEKPDSWMDVAMQHAVFADNVEFLNGLKHTFVLDFKIQRVGVFAMAATLRWGSLLPAFALGHAPCYILWGDTSTSHDSVPVQHRLNNDLRASALPITVAPPTALHSTVYDDSLDASNAILRHCANFKHVSENWSQYWRRRLKVRDWIRSHARLHPDLQANLDMLDRRAKETWTPLGHDVVFK
jgi:hypothetical protein